ncbi:hypothetical protein SAMN04487827_1096 [Prevotella sp. khp7]|nr:hypothetical protein SAMN04487827_1096 [Prevotella sp. khp7]
MTSQIFKSYVCVMVLLLTTVVNVNAQEIKMDNLLMQSLSRLQEPSPQNYLTCIAELKRIDTMYPDSIQPKYQIALQSLNYSVMNPQAEQTENLLKETEQTIEKMKQMGNADQSDISTLTGYLYMTRIVQNPTVNGQRYYLMVMQCYEKALKLNPENKLAKDLQQKFFDGMQKATKQ